MYVLVDYDNIDRLDKNRGVDHVVRKLLSNVGDAELSATPRVEVRLYGGWYEADRRTRLALDLLTTLDSQFPAVQAVPIGAETRSVVVSVNLISSLARDPTFEYVHTYRKRGVEGPLECHAPPFHGCVSTEECPMSTLHAVIASSGCTHKGCMVELSNVLQRAQQKLVDTLLAADLIYYASKEPPWIAVATTDDDLWPAIHTAVQLRARVIHLSTRTGRTASPAYHRADSCYSFRPY